MSNKSGKLEASAAIVLDRGRYNGNAPKKQHHFASSKVASRLKYQDFLPDRTKSGHSQENCLHLLSRANDWLRKNTSLHVKVCETVTWMSHDPKLLDDSEQMVLTKKAKSNSTTYFVRGLRLWLVPRAAGRPETLSFRDFVPDNTTTTVQELIAKANRKFSHSSYKGQILTTETVGMPIQASGSIDSTLTQWTESADSDSPYAFVVRVHYIKDGRNNLLYGNQGVEIGMKDVIPQLKGDRYDGFEELIDRANSWLKDQSDIVITNMQSLTVQKNTGPHSETGNACYYTIPGLSNDHPTEFFRILRIAYAKPIGNHLPDLPIIYPFTFQTFAPEILKAKDATAMSAPESRMERMRETFYKGLAYIRTSGAEVICAETVMNPMQFYAIEGAEDLQQPDEISFLLTIRLFVTDQVSSYDPDAKRSSIASNKDRSSPEQPTEHPGPIFLRNVVTRRYKYRWLAVAIFAVTCMTIIVVLSVVYSNK